MEKFTIREGESYIELNNLLKIMGWVLTGGEAKNIIMHGEVKVNGEVEIQVRKKLRSGDLVRLREDEVQIK